MFRPAALLLVLVLLVGFLPPEISRASGTSAESTHSTVAWTDDGDPRSRPVKA